MVRFAGVSAVAVLAGTLLGGPAWAGVETYLYAVEHPTYGNIGTYTNTVLRSGDNVQVKTKLHIAVKVLGVRLFHQDADRTEEWKDGRLVAFQVPNGESEAQRVDTHKPTLAREDHFGLSAQPMRLHRPVLYRSSPR